MICSKDIAVVIQGPMCRDKSPRYPTTGVTQQLLANLASLLPEAQLILSTWAGQDVSSVPANVEVVFSADPGAQGTGPGMIPINVNRQLVSTRAGLTQVTRRYVLKIRSDMILESTRFIDLFVKESKAQRVGQGGTAIFKSRLVCNNLSSRQAESCPAAFLFHPGDHAQFGLAEDVVTFWAGALQDESDARWFETHCYPDAFRTQELSRFTPEQHIWLGALQAKGIAPRMADYGDRLPELQAQSEALLATNFIFVPDHQFDVYFPKYHSLNQATFEFMRRNSMRELGAYDPVFALKCTALRQLKRTVHPLKGLVSHIFGRKNGRSV